MAQWGRVMGWQLWRQDENGNRFMVEDFASRELAEKRLAELTQVQHKQTYWINASIDGNDRQA